MDENTRDIENMSIGIVGRLGSAIYTGTPTPYLGDRGYLTGPPIKPRILRCSNGHETAGEYVQMIGDHGYCMRCLAAMLDGFGARVRERE